MERFCILFIIFVLIFILLFKQGFHDKNEADQIHLSSQAIYIEDGKQIKWSRNSKAQVDMVEMYRNANFTKAFCMIHVTDMTDMSTLATDYTVFMGNVKGDAFEHDVKSAFYVFGNTGYMGFSLFDEQGFSPALTTVIIRNTSMIAEDQSSSEQDSDEATEEAGNSDSFSRFNQIMFNVNFAGEDGIVVDCLNNPDSTATDMYIDMVAYRDFDKYKELVNEDLLAMNNDLSRLNEYKRRLESYGFTNIPDIPVCVNGDMIITDAVSTEDNPVVYDESMLSYNTAVINSDYNKDLVYSDEADAKRFIDADNLYLQTKFVFPGGVQFNYQDVDVHKNYLINILPEGYNYYAWRNLMSSNYDTSSSWYDPDKAVWTLNGVLYTPSEKKGKGEDIDVTANNYDADILNFNNTMLDLIEMKRKYQKEDLFKILDMVNAVQNMGNIIDINAGENVMHILGKKK